MLLMNIDCGLNYGFHFGLESFVNVIQILREDFLNTLKLLVSMEEASSLFTVSF
jgi:hypothetical protein